MDTIAHTLFGAALAQTGPIRRMGSGATLALIAASNIPDIDALYSMTQGSESMLLRRTLTHSVFALPLIALGLASLLKLILRKQNYLNLLLLCAIGIAGHLFFDLLNSYGVVLLYPFSMRRFELSWVFIVDPVFWGLLAVPLLLHLIVAKRSALEVSANLSIVLLFAYIALCGFARESAFGSLRQIARNENLSPDFEYVFPEVFGPHLFRGVLRSDDLYRMYLIDLWQGKSDLMYEARTEDANPLVKKVKGERLGRQLVWFFKAPVWKTVETKDAKTGQSSTVVTVSDLRFRSLVLKRKSRHFTFAFDEQGRQIS